MERISTQALAGLPGVAQLRDLLQSLALLDAILCPDWDGRYYSFDAHWGRSETLGSMRNGSGDEFFALFNTHACFFKGFVHDSPLAAAMLPPAEHYRGLPAEFRACTTEPAFSPEHVTFCLWRETHDTAWKRNAIPLPPGVDPDGSEFLLSLLDGKPETYERWAEDYYEREVLLRAVVAIYQQKPLTDALLASLNPELTLEDLQDDLAQIGYPVD